MDWYTLLIMVHIIGVALGAGGATISDILFFKSIKDGKIDKKEFALLKAVSSVVWTGFVILAFSGFGFLILYRLTPEYAGLMYDPKLWAKLFIVLIILLNGLVMHWKVFPLLESSLGKPLAASRFIKKSSIAFTTGAISIISWYSALILGAWRTLDASYITIFGAYLLIIFAGIVFANIAGRYFIKYINNKIE